MSRELKGKSLGLKRESESSRGRRESVLGVSNSDASRIQARETNGGGWKKTQGSKLWPTGECGQQPQHPN